MKFRVDRRWGYHVVIAAGLLGTLWVTSFARTADLVCIRKDTLLFVFGGLVIVGKLLGGVIRNGGGNGHGSD